MPDISQIHHHLIGVSFLEDQDRDHIFTEWTDRFQKELSVWVDAKAEDGEFQIMQRVFQTVQQQGYDTMAGLNVVLTCFYDLRREDALTQAQRIAGLARLLSGTGGLISVTMQFGFVGDIPSPDGEKRRQCVNMIAQQNIGRLCLIAKNAFSSQEGNNWKAAVILLDLLRRDNAPDALLPLSTMAAVNAVGYLKYAEYNEAERQQLQEELNRVNQALDTQGSNELRNRIRDELNTIDLKAEKHYPVNGYEHPYHPGMIVEPGFMNLKRNAAIRGTNKEYNAAVGATTRAVEETAKRLMERMEQDLLPDDAGAKVLMRRILEESGAGYRLITGLEDLCAQLNLSVESESLPGLLHMPYQEKGHGATIDMYLKECRRYYAYRCKKQLLERLVKAFEALKPEFEAQIETLEREQRSLNTKLAQMLNWNAFVQMVKGPGNRMETCFRPILGGGEMRKYILWREPQDQAVLTAQNPQNCYYIHRKNGSLKYVDDARVKALHVFFDACTDEKLRDLIS